MVAWFLLPSNYWWINVCFLTMDHFHVLFYLEIFMLIWFLFDVFFPFLFLFCKRSVFFYICSLISIDLFFSYDFFQFNFYLISFFFIFSRVSKINWDLITPASVLMNYLRSDITFLHLYNGKLLNDGAQTSKLYFTAIK